MKKFLIVTVVLIMCSCLCGVPAYADDPSIEISSVEGSQGSSVTVTASISGNPGFFALSAAISYDSDKLELIAISAGSLINDAAMNPATGKISFSSAGNVYGDGTLFNAVFKIRDDASGSASVGADFSIYNEDLVQVFPNVTTGTVSIKEANAGEQAQDEVPADEQAAGSVDAQDEKQKADLDGTRNDEQAAGPVDAQNDEQAAGSVDAQNEGQAADTVDAQNEGQAADTTDAQNDEQAAKSTDAQGEKQTADPDNKENKDAKAADQEKSSDNASSDTAEKTPFTGDENISVIMILTTIMSISALLTIIVLRKMAIKQ